MRNIARVALTLPLIAACSDVTQPPADISAVRTDVSATSSGATHTEGMFFATAACNSDIGFDIRFGGPRVLREHVSPAGITRSFGTQDFQGWRLPETTIDQTTVDFEVLGGAEMFNIKPNENGVMQTRVHEGTLVFAALDGSYKVVARHIIRNAPSGAQPVNRWECRIVG